MLLKKPSSNHLSSSAALLPCLARHMHGMGVPGRPPDEVDSANGAFTQGFEMVPVDAAKLSKDFENAHSPQRRVTERASPPKTSVYVAQAAQPSEPTHPRPAPMLPAAPPPPPPPSPVPPPFVRDAETSLVLRSTFQVGGNSRFRCLRFSIKLSGKSVALQEDFSATSRGVQKNVKVSHLI